MYSISCTGLLKRMYNNKRFIKGTLPLLWKTEKESLNVCPSTYKSTLKAHNSRKALNNSGDLSTPLSPTFLYVLFLWYKGSSDCIIPVTQKNVKKLLMNMNISHCPMSSFESLLLVNNILTIRKITGFINW